MAELDNKNIPAETEQPKVDNSDNYIEAIKEMKQNTVDKKAYEELKEQNKQLLQSLINGETIDQPKENAVNVDELRKTIFEKDCTNLSYIENALKLREELINKGEKDPFLPYGKNILPTDDDIAKADKVATVLQDCVDIADGDSSIFTNELQRRLVDPVLPRKR